jgi:hypothetical protein
MFELSKAVDVFADFNKQLEDAKVLNEQTIFDYEDKKGNKDARSHVYKLRQAVSAIDKVRKKEKAKSLEYGRAIDKTAKGIVEELRSMITVHEEPIKAIEDREKKRIENIEININYFVFYTCDENTTSPLLELKIILKSVEEKVIDNSFCEFIESAELAKFKAIDFLKKKINYLEKEEKAEKERLTKIAEQDRLVKIEAYKKAETERIEREKRIANEARENAEREAKEREHIAEQGRIFELEKFEREKKEEIARIEVEKQHAIQSEKDRVIRENVEKERIANEARIMEEKRQSNRAHQKRINNTVLEYLTQLGCDKSLGKKIITSLAKKEIPNLTINY